MSAREIPLGSTGKVTIVDEDDWYRFRYLPLTISSGYAVYTTTRSVRALGYPTAIKLHRMIMLAPDGLVVDHINGNRLDNRKSNLRICDKSQNGANRTSYKGRQYKPGVSHDPRNKSKPWKARISLTMMKPQKLLHLGYFATEDQAYEAYVLAHRQMFKEFSPYWGRE